MSTLKAVNLQNPASGIVNAVLNANGTTTFGAVVTFAAGQTFPNAVSSLTAGTGLTGGTITTSGTIALDTAYTDGLYLELAGGTMVGDITFSGTQTFPNVLELTGGTMTGDITFSGTQTFPAQDLQEVTDAGGTTTNAIDVGGLTAAGLNYPLTDGASGDVMTTDGAGGLSFTTPIAYDLQTVTDNGAISTNVIDVAGLIAANLNYPLTDGAVNQVMATDGAGNLGWLDTVTVVSPPGSSADSGTLGEVAYDASYFYWFDGAGWQRVAAEATPW